MLIQYERESEERGRVSAIYYMDYEHLIGRGSFIEVNELPTEEIRTGKSSILYANPQTAELWYEYEDRPLTVEEQVVKLNEQIADFNIAMAEIMGVM